MIALAFNCFAGAQDINHVVSNADSLISLGEYEDAILEYNRALYFCEDPDRAGIIFKLADCYSLNGDIDKARDQYKHACDHSADDSLQAEIIFQLALLDIQQNRYYSAFNNLEKIPNNIDQGLLSRKLILTGVACWGLGDYQGAFNHFRSSVIVPGSQKVDSLIALQAESSKMLKPGFSILPVMSSLVPGSGQIMAGHPRDGLMSFTLCSGIGSAAVISIFLTNYNAFFLFAGPYFLRYYLGGIQNALEMTAEKKGARRSAVCSEALRILEVNDMEEYKTVYCEVSVDRLPGTWEPSGGFLQSLLGFYKKNISNQDIIDCIYYPSCSEYAVETLRMNGIIGFFDAIDRLMRCHLLGQKNYPHDIYTDTFYDPVRKINKNRPDKPLRRIHN